MKTATIFVTAWCGVLLLLTGCDQKPVPLKEGVITKVMWTTDEDSRTGLYRGKMPDNPPPGHGGSYNVDVYGLLYPSHLEVRFVDSPNSRSQIIPLNQIIWLEFGDAGATLSKP